MKSVRGYRIIFDIFFMAALAVFYLYFALDRLQEQGVYCDVALLGNKAMGIYKNIHFEGPDFINLFGRSFPLMLLDYHGPAEIYLSLPALYIFGNTAFALNIVPVAFAVLSIPVFYMLALLLYESRMPAVSSCILLFTLPSFIAASRVGLYTGTLVLFFGLSAVLCLLLWGKSGRFSFLCLSCLFIGMGMGSRCFFLWFIVALAAFLFFIHRQMLRAMLALKFRNKLVCVVLSSIGILPVVVFNLRSNLRTARFLFSHLIISNDGISNLKYADNLKERMSELFALLRGSAYSMGDNLINLYIVSFGLAVIVILLFKRRFHCTAAEKRFLLPVALSAAVMLQSSITPSGLQPLHILYVLPFVLMSGATAVSMARGRTLRAGLGALLLFATTASLTVSFLSLRFKSAHLQLHGGEEARWNTARDVLAWLDAKGIRRIGLGDTGIKDVLLYLSGWRLDVDEVFYAQHFNMPRHEKELILRKRLGSEKEGYYLFRAAGTHWIDYLGRFKAIVKEEGLRMEVAAEFTAPVPDRRGVFTIYKVRGRKTT
ncbi:MAG: glycosyltransferase family 39 protein [Candidatus Omnitrophica bacterium]|nr:glycosyltransferase family 39 protein [Candidatus Omnitrophota bacterium]